MASDLTALVEALKQAMEARVEVRKALRLACEKAEQQIINGTLVGDHVTVNGVSYLTVRAGWFGEQCEGAGIQRSGSMGEYEVLLADGACLSTAGRRNWHDRSGNEQVVCRSEEGAYFYDLDDNEEIFVATWAQRKAFIRDLPEIIEAFRALQEEHTQDMRDALEQKP